MEAKELIESGSLELYVLGSLPVDETRQIDDFRKIHHEVNDEILRIEDAMIAYADSHAIEPNAELKEKIAKKLNFAVTLDLQNERIDSILIQIPGIYKFIAAASVTIIVVFAFTAGYFYTRYNHVNNELIALQNEKTQLAEQIKGINAEDEKTKQQLTVATDPFNKAIALKGQSIAPTARAVVFWNNETGATYVNVSQLPKAGTNEQYQLWGIVNGKPIDLGVIDKNSTFAQMKAVQNAKAFAITLEPMGGKPTPTMEKMYVLGNS